jgi:hypothetical protein
VTTARRNLTDGNAALAGPRRYLASARAETTETVATALRLPAVPETTRA